MTGAVIALAWGMLMAAEGLSQTGATVAEPRIDLFWSDYELLSRRLAAGARKAVEREARKIFAEEGSS